LSLNDQVDKLTNDAPVPVVLFARVSSEAQDFGRPLRDLERHAARAGCEVVATIAEKLSGSRRRRAQRPAPNKLLAPGITEFRHRSTTYALPEPRLLDAKTIEYVMAQIYFHQFAHPQRPPPAALGQLVATRCRPLRADLQHVQRDPLWNGIRRERYNAKRAKGRATELADAPLGVKIMVLHYFLAAQRFIHRNYKEVLKKAEAPSCGS
jgi:hypothetical protein